MAMVSSTNGNQVKRPPVRRRQAIDDRGDGLFEYREVLQFACTCSNGLNVVFDVFSRRNRVSLAALEGHPWENEYNFDLVSVNDDTYIDREELDLLVVVRSRRSTTPLTAMAMAFLMTSMPS